MGWNSFVPVIIFLVFAGECKTIIHILVHNKFKFNICSSTIVCAQLLFAQVKIANTDGAQTFLK